MTRLFVDLDGVLCDFEAGAAAVLGMSCLSFRELHGEALMWKRIGQRSGFYETLPWMKGGKTLWREVNQSTTWDGPPPVILTGLPLGDWAQPQKRAWVARELGAGVPVICCMSKDKCQDATEGDILIDDREEARLDWVRCGGRFIHHETATGSLAALAELLQS